MEPEQRARLEIDRQLAAAGWIVQDHKAMNLAAGSGIAVREFPLETGPVDYLLYAGSKVIGVIEVKPEGHALKGVEIQSRKYAMGVPANLPAWRRPPPFAYESTGAVTQFTNGLEPDARSREVFTFHRPEELVRLAGLEAQVRGRLRSMPSLAPGNLWPVQSQSVENLEKALAKGLPRSLDYYEYCAPDFGKILRCSLSIGACGRADRDCASCRSEPFLDPRRPPKFPQ